MNTNQKSPGSELRYNEGAIRLGFVPTADCAPIVMADALGLFRKYGLRVSLQRELGWATIRDKMILGELDAAHALATMPGAITLGLGSVATDCLTGLVLSLNGNAITLSRSLHEAGVRQGMDLRTEVASRRDRMPLTFGIVSFYSSHHYLLRRWLTQSGINPDRDVRTVVVPPPQMVANLRAGHLDGFCVGEPWNSVAVDSGFGWCVSTSADLEPGHPEKVLMVRRDFAEHRSAEHIALIAALLDACEYCETPANRIQVVEALAGRAYLNLPQAVLRRGFEGAMELGFGQRRQIADFIRFHGGDANEPDGAKAAWTFQVLRSVGGPKNPGGLTAVRGRQIFREDIYAAATTLRHSQNTTHEPKTRFITNSVLA